MGGIVQIERNIRYAPLPSQRRFHASAARFKAFCGPVGSGKSAALCQEAIRLSYVNGGLLGLLAAPTYPMLRDATQRAFFAILEESAIPFTHHKSENRTIMTDTGSEVLFRSLDAPERLRGPNLAWFGVDELTYAEPEAWSRLEARLRDARATRLEGFAAFTPKGFDWVYGKFVDAQNPGFELIHAKPGENAKHLGDGFYASLEGSYDERFYKQEVLGEFLSVFAGQAYWAFSRGENVRTLELDKRLGICWALDFNVDPMSTVVIQELKGEVRVLDEIVIRSSDTLEACREFQSRYGKPARVYGDAAGQARHTAATMSDWQLIRDFFRGVEVRVPAANPAIRDRIQSVNAKLCNARGQRSLYIDPKCKTLIEDLERVAYKAGTSQLDKSDLARTHVSDALGYYVWYEHRLRAPIGERSQRLVA